ncbi:DUF1206 domain-containing protein [Stutzerimonas azotifigens]|uniref:DUF1206 domain-containing protein n=1 Tax=Stutzerimonas azotifigens TaxID=291995 RepID=UPI00042A667D|nr:DUF1206 domain-containing protein [Stutzerimonas azotifigens]
MTVTRGVVWLARGGYAARGVVYVIVACFAVMAAMGSGDTVDTRGAITRILEQPFGTTLLWLVALGLLAHVAWRLTQALGDTDGHGTDGKGLLIRAGLVGSALVNGLLAIFALGLLGTGLGSGGAGAGDNDLLARLLRYDNANRVIYLMALVPLGVGIAHLVKAWRLKFERHFQCSEERMRLVRPVARVGLVARGCVFLIIAALLVLGGSRYQPTDPPGLKEALEALQGLPFGWLLLLAIGLGLLAFALYSFAEALWRRIDLAEVMPR